MIDSPIVHFQISSADPAGMALFLRNVFEWDVPGPGTPIAPIETGWSDDIRVAGSLRTASEGQPGSVAIYVRVRDLDATLERAKEHGAAIRMPRTRAPQGQDIAIIQHPEGQTFGLVQL